MSNLVKCRYNPNHKVKSSRLIIHEQKCPDRFNGRVIQCPYNPNEKIRADLYEDHLTKCKYKPNISEKEKHELEEASVLNSIADEIDQIKLARKSFYKNNQFAKEQEIMGLSSKKQNKNKELKKKAKILADHRAKQIGKINDKLDNVDSDNEDGNDNHVIDENFGEGEDFLNDEENNEKEKENESLKNKKNEKSFGNNQNKEKNSKNKEINSSSNNFPNFDNEVLCKRNLEGKEPNFSLSENKNKNLNEIKEIPNYNYGDYKNFQENYKMRMYNPNDEDKDIIINECTWNVLNPKEIEEIEKKYNMLFGNSINQ